MTTDATTRKAKKLALEAAKTEIRRQTGKPLGHFKRVDVEAAAKALYEADREHFINLAIESLTLR